MIGLSLRCIVIAVGKVPCDVGVGNRVLVRVERSGIRTEVLSRSPGSACI